MTVGEAIALGKEFFYLALVLSAPALLASMATGLFISILQTLTSIQEQTLGFVPRLVAAAIVIVLTLPWSLQLAMNYALKAFFQAAQAGHQ
ncbi:MAG: flagellar export apparatus protein FliQ [Gemmataceae bacterium]